MTPALASITGIAEVQPTRSNKITVNGRSVLLVALEMEKVGSHSVGAVLRHRSGSERGGLAYGARGVWAEMAAHTPCRTKTEQVVCRRKGEDRRRPACAVGKG
jgi:hypothetical protein